MIKCQAANLAAPFEWMREIIVKLGFVRIGIGKTFVHLDNDPSKTQMVSWGYPKGAKVPYDPFKRYSSL